MIVNVTGARGTSCISQDGYFDYRGDFQAVRMAMYWVKHT